MTESAANRAKIGITNGNQKDRAYFFYNKDISDILFYDEPRYHNNVEACVDKLDRIAFVSIEFTSADAIKRENGLVGSLVETLTVTGGLMSLYAGFSFLSLAEIMFWIIRYFGHLLWIPVMKAVDGSMH